MMKFDSEKLNETAELLSSAHRMAENTFKYSFNEMARGSAKKEMELIMVALSVISDAIQRQDGCEYCCTNDWERKPLSTFETSFNNFETEEHDIGIDDYEGGHRIASTWGNNGPSVDVRFCPSCGRNLTEKEGGE